MSIGEASGGLVACGLYFLGPSWAQDGERGEKERGEKEVLLLTSGLGPRERRAGSGCLIAAQQIPTALHSRAPGVRREVGRREGGGREGVQMRGLR
jgi:hypothetical protein